jgi:hypothetical protein
LLETRLYFFSGVFNAAVNNVKEINVNNKAMGENSGRVCMYISTIVSDCMSAEIALITYAPVSREDEE